MNSSRTTNPENRYIHLYISHIYYGTIIKRATRGICELFFTTDGSVFHDGHKKSPRNSQKLYTKTLCCIITLLVFSIEPTAITKITLKNMVFFHCILREFILLFSLRISWVRVNTLRISISANRQSRQRRDCLHLVLMSPPGRCPGSFGLIARFGWSAFLAIGGKV